MTAGISYVLPLRAVRVDDDALRELAGYLATLAALPEVVDVVVVDGSPEDVYLAHAEALRGTCRHVRPSGPPTSNGKVRSVRTGVASATQEAVVVADDDVRYDAASLRAVVRRLDQADLVGPQNVFDPLPWHAAWDSSRSLLNRALAADYPGTFALRRSTFLAMGGYDGDVLFENLELIRTVRAHGGRVVRPLDVYVRRLPPTARHFGSQRVRQAYDDLAQPWRLAASLAVWPSVVGALRSRRPVPVLAAAAALVALAEAGRRRAGGAAHFARRCSWFAPLWVLERATCSWVAVAQRLLAGGVPYSGGRIRVAAHSPWRLRARAARQHAGPRAVPRAVPRAGRGAPPADGT